MNMHRVPLLAGVVLLLVSADTLAQSAIDSRVQRLEEMIRLLEARIATLEEQLASRPKVSPATADKMSWRKLQRGMSQAQVEAILGSPEKVIAGPVTVRWYYGTPYSGSVVFDSRSGKLDGWDEP